MIVKENQSTDESEEFPEIEGYAVYKLEVWKEGKPRVRTWAILNGMNSGRWTRFFGPHCIADTVDCRKIAENIRETCGHETFQVPVRITVG